MTDFTDVPQRASQVAQELHRGADSRGALHVSSLFLGDESEKEYSFTVQNRLGKSFTVTVAEKQYR